MSVITFLIFRPINFEFIKESNVIYILQLTFSGDEIFSESVNIPIIDNELNIN